MSKPNSPWAKDGYWKCPTCERHFMGGLAVKHYEGLCNMCDTPINLKEHRVK